MKKLLIVATAALILSSCKKEVNEFVPASPQQTERTTSSTSINQSLDDAALIIAASLKDGAVRSFIKAEALKQFDGDYDILYKSAKNTSINGRSLESIFSANKQGRLSQSNRFENILATIPNFQISVPVHCDEWNEHNYTPLVAIVEQGVNERELKRIKAYDGDGNIHWIDAKADIDMPLIAVGVSERVDENGNLKYTFENNNVAAQSRVSGQNTILGSIMCPNLSDIEPAIKGKPELRLRIFGSKLTRGSLNPTAIKIAEKFYSPKRSQINGTWYNPGTSCFNWYTDWNDPLRNYVYGSDVKFAWVEEDGGTSVNVNINIGGTIGSSSGSNINVGVKTSFTIQDNDENLGDAVVYFGDPTYNYVYSTGSELDFKLN